MSQITPLGCDQSGHKGRGGRLLHPVCAATRVSFTTMLTLLSVPSLGFSAMRNVPSFSLSPTSTRAPFLLNVPAPYPELSSQLDLSLLLAAKSALGQPASVAMVAPPVALPHAVVTSLAVAVVLFLFVYLANDVVKQMGMALLVAASRVDEMRKAILYSAGYRPGAARVKRIILTRLAQKRPDGLGAAYRARPRTALEVEVDAAMANASA